MKGGRALNPKKKTPYDDQREILEELGCFETDDYYDCGFDEEKCDYCGCGILSGQLRARVYTTGDIIHYECWQDYAEDNFDELCCALGD